MSAPGASAHGSGTIGIGGDLTVHRMGFGAMRITGAGIWGDPPDREVAKAVLRRVVELGVNLIDTADSYGPAVSEELIAEALHPYPDDLVIATKGGLERSGPGEWPINGRPEHLKQVCDESLRRLRLEQIPLYQQHRPDPTVPYDETIGALVELKEQGKIRHIGLSNVDEGHLRTAQGMTPIVSVQNRYNVRDRRSEAMLDLCEQEQIAFLPYSPGAGLRGPFRGAGRRGAPRRHGDAGDPRVAAGALAGDGADPRHRFGLAPRGERRGREHRARPGRGRRDHGVGELILVARGDLVLDRELPRFFRTRDVVAASCAHGGLVASGVGASGVRVSDVVPTVATRSTRAASTA